MIKPSFSILTIAPNDCDSLRSAVESVLSQEGCGEVEHLVVGCKDDPSLQQLASEYKNLRVVAGDPLSPAKALNAAMAQARGGVISFLGHSERLARGALSRVITEVDRHPVVLGAWGICDARGALLARVPNTERSWFDTIKYWVAYAIPYPSGIFFKRQILADLGVDELEAFDEGLHLVPEIDLWLRIQEAQPFSLALGDILVYRPEGDSLARNVASPAYQMELSRVFRRHASRRVQPEQNLSFVIPLFGDVGRVADIVDHLSTQNLPSLEVVLVDQFEHGASAPHALEMIKNIGSKVRDVAIQYVALELNSERSLAAAYDAGVRSARSHIVACLNPNRKLGPSFAAELLKSFARDEVGLVFPSLSAELKDRLFVDKHGTQIFNPVGPFNLPVNSQIEFAVRKIAWLDSGGFSLHDRFPSAEFSMKRLLVMLAHKAWRITSASLLEPIVSSNSADHEAPFRLYENSVVVDEIAREMRRDPFSVMRAKFGFGLVLPDDLWRSAQEVLSRIPADLNAGLVNLDRQALSNLVNHNPVYSPALYRLAESLMREGLSEDGKQVLNQWRAVYEGEMESPLFGGWAPER